MEGVQTGRTRRNILRARPLREPREGRGVGGNQVGRVGTTVGGVWLCPAARMQCGLCAWSLQLPECRTRPAQMLCDTAPPLGPPGTDPMPANLQHRTDSFLC